MKNITALFLALATSAAWANGNVAQQADGALSAALAELQKTEPSENLDLLKSVTAELTGHETFTVTMVFSDNKYIQYNCPEDESVNPAIWVCARK
jgi:hypothetical protein